MYTGIKNSNEREKRGRMDQREKNGKKISVLYRHNKVNEPTKDLQYSRWQLTEYLITLFLLLRRKISHSIFENIVKIPYISESL